MKKTVTIGSEEKGDCLVSVSERKGLEIEITATVPDLVERGIRAVVERTARTLGLKTGGIAVEDKGALDHILSARVEAAVREMFPSVTAWRPTVEWQQSARDRLRRTRLYAPGNNSRLLAGIELHGADCVLLDLEDSVPVAEKLSARILIKHLLAKIVFPEVWVRINPLSTYGSADLDEVMLGQPHGICLPKAESAGDVQALAQLLSRLEGEMGIEKGRTFIMPIIETGKGVLHAEEIAAADPRVVIIAFGAEDYTRDVGARRTRDALLFPRSRLVAASAAARIQASDTVYADIDDEDGLAEETRHIRDLGFVGKGAINPRQIRAIHEAFSPSGEEIAHATKIIAAAEEAAARGIGAIAIGGKMIDQPVLERARRTLRIAAEVKEEWQ